MPPRPHCRYPPPGTRRAIVLGAGSFGTATAVLLARGGFRTTLQTRTPEQARARGRPREQGVPRRRRAAARPADGAVGAGSRAPLRFLGVPSRGLDEVIAGLGRRGAQRPHAGDLARRKGLVPPHGTGAERAARDRAGRRRGRVRSVDRPTRTRWSPRGAGLVAASTGPAARGHDRQRLHARGRGLRAVQRPDRRRAGGRRQAHCCGGRGRAPQAQDLNAAGAAQGHTFGEIWRFAGAAGAPGRVRTTGLAGTGDLVATALAPQSRNRRAGELLAVGIPAAEIPGADRATVDTVPPQKAAETRAGSEAPVTQGAPSPDRRRAPARRVGRAGPRQRPAASPSAPAAPGTASSAACARGRHHARAAAPAIRPSAGGELASDPRSGRRATSNWIQRL